MVNLPTPPTPGQALRAVSVAPQATPSHRLRERKGGGGGTILHSGAPSPLGLAVLGVARSLTGMPQHGSRPLVGEGRKMY